MFGVRVTTDGRGLVLPVYSFTGALVGVKIISALEEADSVKMNITTRTIPRFVSFVVCHCSREDTKLQRQCQCRNVSLFTE